MFSESKNTLTPNKNPRIRSWLSVMNDISGVKTTAPNAKYHTSKNS